MEFKLKIDLSKPKTLAITKDFYTTSLFHLMLIILATVLFVIGSTKMGRPITEIASILYVVVFVMIGISWLDYIDVIKFRKTEARLLRCSLCSRTARSSFTKNNVNKTETDKKGKDPDGDGYKEKSTTKTTVTEEIPSEPFHAIVFHEKPICINCYKELKKLQRLTESK